MESSVDWGFVYYSKFESEKIISRIVGISEGCDQNGDRVSKNDKSCHICIMRQKGVIGKMKNMELCL